MKLASVHFHGVLYSCARFLCLYPATNDALCCLLSNPCPRAKPQMWDLSRETADKWEIPRQEIELTEQLGAGNFGEVWRGMLAVLFSARVNTDWWRAFSINRSFQSVMCQCFTVNFSSRVVFILHRVLNGNHTGNSGLMDTRYTRLFQVAKPCGPADYWALAHNFFEFGTVLQTFKNGEQKFILNMDIYEYTVIILRMIGISPQHC
jgi:hypothetical protein